MPPGYPSLDALLKVEIGVSVYEARELIKDPSERGKMGGRGNKASNNNTSFRRGDTPAYLTARLKDEAPTIYQAWQSGAFSSVHAAAVEAGIRPRTFTIPADPQKAAAAIRRHFTEAQVHALKELL